VYTGVADAAESEAVRRHLDECVPCLKAYIDVQAVTLDALPEQARTAVLAERIRRGERVNPQTEPLVVTLQQQISELLAALVRAAQIIRHRHVQRQYSDPAVEGPQVSFWLADLSSSLRSAPELPLDPTPEDEEIERKLRRLEGAANEVLDAVQTFRHLLTSREEVRARIDSAEIPSPLKRALTDYLSDEFRSQGSVLDVLLTRLLAK